MTAHGDASPSEMRAPIRVMVVDDQAIVRSGFRTIISMEPDLAVVGEAADGLAAVEHAAECRPDVVVMDIRMPRLDGIEATRRLTSADHPCRVLVVTTFDLDGYVFGALRAGASGFLLKDTEPDALVDAIRTVATGDALVSPAVTRRLIEAALAGPPPARTDQIPLTDREREILVALARGRSNAGLAKSFQLSEATVKTHISSLLTKLGLTSRVQAVVYAYECGLVRPGDLALDDIGD